MENVCPARHNPDKTEEHHLHVNKDHHDQVNCDRFRLFYKPFYNNLSILRSYQVTFVYCDVSRYSMQYKKSGTFKFVPQPSYLSER